MVERAKYILKTPFFKGGNREVSLSARKAMRFLQVKLGEKTLSLKGQKMSDILEKEMLKVIAKLLTCSILY